MSELQNIDRISLERISDRSIFWRERRRADALILLDDGLTMVEVSAKIGIEQTVGSMRTSWLFAR